MVAESTINRGSVRTERSQRNCLQRLEDFGGDFEKLIAMRYFSRGTKSTQHHDEINGTHVFPERIQRPISAGFCRAHVLDPSCLRQLRNMRRRQGKPLRRCRFKGKPLHGATTTPECNIRKSLRFGRGTLDFPADRLARVPKDGFEPFLRQRLRGGPVVHRERETRIFDPVRRSGKPGIRFHHGCRWWRGKRIHYPCDEPNRRRRQRIEAVLQLGEAYHP